MLYEDQVINYIISYLTKNGYNILSSCDTYQRGYDIKAKKGDEFLYVETKGQTSSKETARKGKPFTHAQKKSHVAMAIYKTMRTQQEHPDGNVAIALPLDVIHKKLIENILPSLNLSIGNS